MAGVDAEYLPLDPDSGALIVQGAGVVPTATALRVQDGDTFRTATVGPDRALLVRDVGTVTAGVDTSQVPAMPLAANEVFLGPWEPTAGFSEIVAAVRTDVPSVTDGVAVEFSIDGSDAGWIKTESATIPGGGIGLSFRFAANDGAFFRIRYANGPTAQGYLVAQVQKTVRPSQQAILPLGAQVDDTNTATVTRSSLFARHSSGAHLPITTAGDGRLNVATGQQQPLTDAQLAARALATDASVQAVTAALAGRATDAALVPLLDGIEGLLTAIRDRPNEALTDAQLRAKFIRTGPRIAYHAGRDGGRTAYNSSTDLLTLTGQGDQPFCALVNPTGSGVDLHIIEFKQSASIATVTRRLRNASVTVTGAPRTNVNRGGGTSLGGGRFYSGGTYTTSGGVVGQVQHLAAGGTPSDRPEGGIILRPGMSLVWTISAPGVSALTSYTASMEPIWLERAAEPD